MRFGFIGAAAAALCVAMPAQATVVVQIDAYGTGATEIRTNACLGLCSSTPEARYFTIPTAIELAEGASTRFTYGPGGQDGQASGTITRSGYDIYGAVYYVGSDFRYARTYYDYRDNMPVGSTSTVLTANSFTVRQTIPAPVPEPATWALMILGFGVAGWSLRRQKVAAPALS